MSLPTIDIWTIDRDPHADLGLLAECLSSDEMVRAERLRVAERRAQFIYNRAMLRRILSTYADIEPGEVPLTTSAAGKPLWKGSRLHFNVSHCQDLAVVAVSREAAVGVDIEALNDRADFNAIARIALSPQEAERLQHLPPAGRPAAVLRAWTRKEAVFKALGTGLGRPLAQIEVTFSDSEPAQILASGDPQLLPADWFLHDWSPREGWFAALAAARLSMPWRLRHFSAAQLRDESSQQARLPVDPADVALVTR
jgi:4'-phosphopantetheinyl transferase